MTECPDSRSRQLWSMAFGFFMPSLDTIIVNTALPSMAKLAIGMAVLALNGSKSMGISPQVLAALAAGGAAAILLYLFHAKNQARYLACDCSARPRFHWGYRTVLPGVSAAVCSRLSRRFFCKLVLVFIGVDSSATHHVFMYTWPCMAVIIALPAIIFARLPNDTQQNMVISRRKRSL